MLENKLEIILITYNRKQYLEDTLNQLFCDSSPIKNCKFTILDNCSSDGTTELIEEYAKKYNNIKHIRHNKNIGGNANITRAIEKASSEYFWILCDDDKYDWTAFNEIENAINEDKDIILVTKELLKKKNNIGLIVRQLTFLPAGIYKTANVTSSVLQGAYNNITFLLPHMSLITSLVNSNKISNIHITSESIVIPQNLNREYTRGNNDPDATSKRMFWIIGFINAIQSIKDKKTKKIILNNLTTKFFGFFSMICAEFKYNRMYYNNSFRNICDVFTGINLWQKIQFLLALIWLDVIYFIKRFILRNKKYIPQK